MTVAARGWTDRRRAPFVPSGTVADTRVDALPADPERVRAREEDIDATEAVTGGSDNGTAIGVKEPTGAALTPLAVPMSVGAGRRSACNGLIAAGELLVFAALPCDLCRLSSWVRAAAGDRAVARDVPGGPARRAGRGADFVAGQLGMADPSQVKRYTEREKTRFDHQ